MQHVSCNRYAHDYGAYMTATDKTLGRTIRELRETRGWSQEEVARRIGVGHLAVGKWERDQANPAADNLIKLAKLYGVAPQELGYEPPVWTPATPPEWAIRYHDDLTRRLNLLIEHFGIAQ
jgi:transcriptional regulator with XRE-family HTH domain